MIDTEEGIRYYFFFEEYPEAPKYVYYCGNIIRMVKTLSYSDFSSLRKGDSIEKVSEIDPGTLDQEVLWRLGNPSGNSIEKAEEIYQMRYEWGCRTDRNSFHLLTDGLLIISYEPSGDTGVITSMHLYRDFCYTSWKEKTCYRIEPIDYKRE